MPKHDLETELLSKKRKKSSNLPKCKIIQNSTSDMKPVRKDINSTLEKMLESTLNSIFKPQVHSSPTKEKEHKVDKFSKLHTPSPDFIQKPGITADTEIENQPSLKKKKRKRLFNADSLYNEAHLLPDVQQCEDTEDVIPITSSVSSNTFEVVDTNAISIPEKKLGSKSKKRHKKKSSNSVKAKNMENSTLNINPVREGINMMLEKMLEGTLNSKLKPQMHSGPTKKKKHKVDKFSKLNAPSPEFIQKPAITPEITIENQSSFKKKKHKRSFHMDSFHNETHLLPAVDQCEDTENVNPVTSSVSSNTFEVLDTNSISMPERKLVSKNKKKHKKKKKKSKCYMNVNDSLSGPVLNGDQGDIVNMDVPHSISFSRDQESCSDYEPPMHVAVDDLDCTPEEVNFNIPPLHQSETVCMFTEEQKNIFQSQRVDIKMGKFSKEEDSLLKRNFKEFIERFHVNDPYILLGLGQKNKNPEVVNFLRAKRFYVFLGKDLNNRPLRNIYMRARVLFDPLKKKGPFHKKDIRNLKKAYNRVGSKWHEVGTTINRSATASREAYRWHEKSVNIGKWTPEENRDLIEAIKEVVGTTNLSDVQLESIPWEAVAKLIPTRNFFQCRLHWEENLSWKLKGNKWNEKCWLKFINILEKKCHVEDDTRIDWEMVQKCFGDLSPTCAFLRKKWRYLKSRRLPPKNEMDFRQMITYLSKDYNSKYVNSKARK